MEGVRLPNPEMQDCYSKNIFPNTLDFVSNIGVTYQRQYDRKYRE